MLTPNDRYRSIRAKDEGLTVDTDQQPRRVRAQRRQRGNGHARNILTAAGGDDGNPAGETSHDRAELAFDFVGLVDEVDIRLAHWSYPPPAPRRLCFG
ncbi:hypothetical protein V1283_000223 [Bradyrhizobium sp. AZCC 2262]